MRFEKKKHSLALNATDVKEVELELKVFLFFSVKKVVALSTSGVDTRKVGRGYGSVCCVSASVYETTSCVEVWLMFE